MRKGILKGILCAALSVTMLTGGVLVGAAPAQKSDLEKSVKTSSSLLKAKNTTKKLSRSIQNNPNSVRNATLVCDEVSYNDVMANKKDAQKNYTNWIVGYVNAQNPMIVRINMPKAGTLFLDSVNQYDDGTAKTVNVKLYKGQATSGNYLGTRTMTQGTLTVQGLARGVYTAVITPYDNTNGYSAVYPYCVTSENIGITSKIRMVMGTGNKMYQDFSIKGRRQVWIDSDNARYGYIEKKSGNKWNRVSDNKYFYATKEGVTRAYYALSTGTYRFVMQPGKGYLVQYRYGSKAYTAKYATKKSKAKQIKRKKSVTNVLTASDKNKATHYYKIKLTKNSAVKINLWSYQNAGKLTFTLYGKGIKTSTITAKNNIKGTWTPLNGKKIKKGTYYIKVTKCTKNTSGTYKIKYTK